MPPPDLGCGVNGRLREEGGAARRAGLCGGAGAPELADMNGFTPEEMNRGGDAAAAVAAVVAAAAAAASAGNGNPAGGGAEVPGAGAVSASGPPGAAGPGPGQLCCLREDGERCGRAAGNASFSKRIQKSISQKKVKIELDKSVSGSRNALPCPILPYPACPAGSLAGFTSLRDWAAGGISGSLIETKSLQLWPSSPPPPQRALAQWCGSPSPLTRTPAASRVSHARLPSSSFAAIWKRNKGDRSTEGPE